MAVDIIIEQDYNTIELVLLSRGRTVQLGEGSFDASQLKSSTLSQLLLSLLSPASCEIINHC